MLVYITHYIFLYNTKDPYLCCFFQAYLEDFYAFCQETGGATADVMCEALSVSCYHYD